MSKRIGRAQCPNCGEIELTDVDLVTVFMGRGLMKPYVHIECERCSMDFAAAVSWEDAYLFDSLGCEVVGFSKARAKPFTDDDISIFISSFDTALEEFLYIIDSEES